MPEIISSLVEKQVNEEDETPNFGDIQDFVKRANINMDKTELANLGKESSKNNYKN